jgi:uncharacterized membrane protein
MTGEQVSVAEIVTDGEYALIAAAFADKVAAADAITTIRNTEAAGEIEVEGVLAVRTDETGKILVDEMTDHSTKSGLKWGAVGGVVLGVIFPPSIIASAVAFGALGGVVGKLRNLHHRGQVADQLADALPPDSSGIIALVRMQDAETVHRSLPAATRMTTVSVDAATARDVREAARQAS